MIQSDESLHASHTHSIEYRVPFLDHRLVEFVFKTPDHQKINRGLRKYLLRNAMRDILPDIICKRTDKLGFPVPQDEWLKTSLRDRIRELINSDSFKKRLFFNAKEIDRDFELYCQDKKYKCPYLWRFINLELWMRKFID